MLSLIIKLVIILLLIIIYILVYKILKQNHINYFEPFISNIKGKVIRGSGLARLYGYRTANLYNTTNLECGIYNGKCQYGDVTVWSKGKSKIECHIHDFNKDIYGEELIITELQPVNNPIASHAHHCKIAKYFI